MYANIVSKSIFIIINVFGIAVYIDKYVLYTLHTFRTNVYLRKWCYLRDTVAIVWSNEKKRCLYISLCMAKTRKMRYITMNCSLGKQVFKLNRVYITNWFQSLWIYNAHTQVCLSFLILLYIYRESLNFSHLLWFSSSFNFASFAVSVSVYVNILSQEQELQACL